MLTHGGGLSLNICQDPQSTPSRPANIDEQRETGSLDQPGGRAEGRAEYFQTLTVECLLVVEGDGGEGRWRGFE